MKNKEKKSERLNVHLTPTNKAIIRARANAFGMDMSSYIVAAAIVNDVTVIGDKDSFNELVRQVRAIGNNINQLRMLAQLGKISVVDLSDCTVALQLIADGIFTIINRTTKWRQ